MPEHRSTTDTNDFYCDFVFSGRVEIDIVRQTDRLLAFHHTRPSYPLHIVIVPKEHIPTLLDIDDLSLFQEIFSIAQSIVRELRLQDSDFRIVTNGGRFQDSKHFHVHLISTGEPTSTLGENDAAINY